MKTAPSIDASEVAYYERLAHTWWNHQGPLWPIHTLNAVRVRYLQTEITRHFEASPAAECPFDGLQILDIGCGGGILSESMARLGARVTGVDVARRNIHVARAHAATSGLDIDYRTGRAEALAAQGERFDVVLNMEVVEHVANLDVFMAACNELVRPGGMMFIATINRNPLAWLTAVLGAEYLLRWLPRGTHHWHKLRKPRELEALLACGRLRVIDRAGVLVSPLTRRMRLGRFTGINYMLTAAKAAEQHVLSKAPAPQHPCLLQETDR